MEPTHETMLHAAFEIDRIAARDRSARWGATREFFQTRGIVVPEYDPRGAIISLSSPYRLRAFSDLWRHELYALLQDQSVDPKRLGSYDLSRSEPCPCQSGRAFGMCHGKA